MTILSPKQTAEELAKIQVATTPEDNEREPLDSELIEDAPKQNGEYLETENDLEELEESGTLPDDNEDKDKDN